MFAKRLHGRALRRPEVEAGEGRGEGQEGRREPLPLPANEPGGMMEGMTMTRTSTEAGRPDTARRGAWRARALVLGPLAIAALATAAALGFSTDTAHLGPLWIAALAWTVLASLAGALLRGFRHGDWSAFRRHRFPEDDGEADEFASRTGRYDWLGDEEDRLLHGD